MKSLLFGQHFLPINNNSNVNSPIYPKFELVQDFIAILITCKSDQGSIKIKIAIVRTTFSEVYGALKGE